ncbi:hypothetical protein [Pontibacter mangrovi]|uniref:Uncharacterized protein n=1 Tax=Pontibacter mangrovi TaxID=2589816 RepID=A0A501WC76_9BACT|nr:hypothetical protein [Pontibacter mangrovi]TPE44417.1 hypothetical protein FJM65_09730 [Pontibacter mangrovi]
MSIKDIFNKAKEEIKKEAKVLQGEELKDKVYQNENSYPTDQEAIAAFGRSKEKLFNVNAWTKLSGVNSTFELYDNRGHRTTALRPEIGYYLKIVLPASTIENWVQITDLREEENLAEFVVHPSEKPKALGEGEAAVKHFFIKEASSTFRVTREGNTLHGYEIGKNEGINNQGEEAGDRAVLNTFVAEGGWAIFQELQWDKLTRYLVHLEEAEEE